MAADGKNERAVEVSLVGAFPPRRRRPVLTIFCSRIGRHAKDGAIAAVSGADGDDYLIEVLVRLLGQYVGVRAGRGGLSCLGESTFDSVIGEISRIDFAPMKPRVEE